MRGDVQHLWVERGGTVQTGDNLYFRIRIIELSKLRYGFA